MINTSQYVLQCASNVLNSQKTQQKKKEIAKLAAWATKKLEEKYASSSSGKNTAVLSDLVKSLHIS